jgi:hypothetical protein
MIAMNYTHAMAAETPTSNKRVLVVGLSTNAFNEPVRDFVEPFFEAVEMILPIEHSVGQPLLRTSEIPPDTIIVAFSTGEKWPTSVATKITEAFSLSASRTLFRVSIRFRSRTARGFHKPYLAE